MTPPYDITPKIIALLTSVSEKIGAANALYLNRQSPQLRKQNQIKTIHSSLQIEGNTLSEAQITAIIENKHVAGPEKDINEVLNAIKVYDALDTFKATSEKDFLKAHKQLMAGLVLQPGQYRKLGVGIVKGTQVAHVAPPATNVPYLMKDLFTYLKTSEDPALIKSCVFHYEMEFIHPFMDGNGRMGRLWQTVVLIEQHPVFASLPFETLISKNQADYYNALALSDKTGKSTPFIEYMLGIIDTSLGTLLNYNDRTMTGIQRLEYFVATRESSFTRKNYMDTFKDISSATASRDLKKGVSLGLFTIKGSGNQTFYKIT
nr:Fic family protein [uncultured Flavobacterium sp.]